MADETCGRGAAGRRYRSGAADQIASYVRFLRAGDRLCASAEENLHLFDTHSARDFPGATELTQGMVDRWCERRPTESANSCGTRCGPVVGLVRFLRERGETDVVAPELPAHASTDYVPHAFTHDELRAFFAECDAWRPAPNVRSAAADRTRLVLPVVFRLLYSSGMRTCEARLLRRENVDLAAGVVRIVEGKGKSQRIVALHPSMWELMRRYDERAEALWPGREYFFPGDGGVGCLARGWMTRWFKELWSRVSDVRATPYMLRHNYCVENVNEMVSGGLDGLRDMEYLSKSMGHASVEITVASYYHIVPALAEAMQDGRPGDLSGILPEVVR